ncbi:MAG TPA: EAL domain-containing protein [Nitrospinae bacterium]|jgi:EAL domain-containing protein (putative c-di-GMP-specific phosphodiesterase class I)|nr:EAL domain-containing protein [Nitrospinota bacterium]
MKKLHIDTLKIDQSFIRDCTDKSNAAIIQGIITISKKMGFKTIAEGVETHEQHDFLKGLECDPFQGYLCSKAFPSDEIARLIWPKDQEDSGESVSIVR